MFTSHILHFFQKSEFPFGIISLHPEEPIEQVLWWQILSFVFSKCLYYTPVVYRDLVCQRFRQFICRLGDSPSVALHSCISPYFLPTVITLVCPLNASTNRFAVFFLNFNYPTGINSKRAGSLLRRSPSSKYLFPYSICLLLVAL